jgi:hypothetical protein
MRDGANFAVRKKTGVANQSSWFRDLSYALLLHENVVKLAYAGTYLAEIAEVVVQEWLNRQGFFTIRGKRDGNRELDILAVKWDNGKASRWHYEVQVSSKPISYISKWPVEEQRKYGVPASSARKLSPEVLSKHVDVWVEKRFKAPEVRKVRESLAPGAWNEAFVHGNVKSPDELRFIEKHGVKLVSFKRILHDLSTHQKRRTGAAGSDLAELVELAMSKFEAK